MNKAVLLILIGTFALITEGCSRPTESGKELEGNTIEPISVQTKAASETELEEFADLEDETEFPQEVAGLIPATNPDIRVRTSVRGRQDPFSVVTLNPRIEIEETKPNNASATRNNSLDRNQNSSSQVARSESSSQVARSEPSLPIPPPPVRPTLAQDVVITGLYQANGVTKLIVQAPEESNSRYVEVGEYLSNGRVLVKSIDMRQSPPLIILEQAGVEVAKAIGENSRDEAETSLLPINNLPAQNYQLSSISATK